MRKSAPSRYSSSWASKRCTRASKALSLRLKRRLESLVKTSANDTSINPFFRRLFPNASPFATLVVRWSQKLYTLSKQDVERRHIVGSIIPVRLSDDICHDRSHGRLISFTQAVELGCRNTNKP